MRIDHKHLMFMRLNNRLIILVMGPSPINPDFIGYNNVINR
jgi:hypothetical protein